MIKSRNSSILSNMQLEIKELKVSIDSKEILKDLNLSIKTGEIHAIMGPNGSGKSTLSLSIMGHPNYKIEKGEILFEKKSIKDLSIDKRAREGIFLAFQHPSSISGVSVANFIRAAYFAQNKDAKFPEFLKILREKMALLKLDDSFINRYINDGFSGGEKKKTEILQLAVLNPKLAILDEIDSGLDIDSLKVVSEAIMETKTENMSILIITHYQRILDYIKPDFIHIMYDGRIIKSGDSTLAKILEKDGYEKIIKEYKK